MSCLQNITQKIETVSICDIDLSDETFKISSDKALFDNDKTLSDNYLSALAASINSIGLIHPPLLRKIEDRYIVVSGFKRIHAMQLTGLIQTAAVVVESDDNNQCSRLAVADNAFQRQLNVMEQTRGVRLLRRFLSVEELVAESQAIFNITMNAALIKMFDELAQMPLSVHNLIETDRLAMNSALKINHYGYNTDSIGVFVRLFSKIKTSLSKQKEIITHLHEIASKESISIADIINADEIKQIIDYNDTDLDNGMSEKLKDNDENRKGNIVRSILFERRYPHLAKAKRRFGVNLKQLNLKGDIKLEPPVDFEGRDYTVTLKFSSVEELGEKVDMLSALSKNPLLGSILP